MEPPLRMRAWTQRRTGGPDAYGHAAEWADQLTDEPCYWWVSSGQEQINPQRSVAIGLERILFPRSADVQAGDRIRQLVDHDGRTVWDIADGGTGLAREVEHVGVQRTHLDVRLRSSI